MDMVQVMCPEPLAPLLFLSHSCSLLLLPRVGVEEPFEEDQNEHHWQYFRWHKGILRNKLTGPGFPPLPNLFLTWGASLYAICLFLCVCQPSAPFSKGAGGQVKSNHFPRFLLAGWCICSWDCVSLPHILNSAGECLLVQLVLVLRAAHMQSHILSPQNSAYFLVTKASSL